MTKEAKTMKTRESVMGNTQTRMVTFICVGIGVALLIILFILLVYCTMAKRRVTDSMDLAKERTNYWQSYQAYDGPEWIGGGMQGGNGRGGGSRVQQESPDGRIHEEIGLVGHRGAVKAKKGTSYPERLI
ncbi:uncharacterized protein [Amphiura filiformis]|uniref:uncharacterized protein n=1 Tax=Amphiura filiformis TaxID=82378 RepID=UPI003B212DC7